MLKKLAKDDLVPVCIVLFWYATLYPGRLGFDSAQAIRMIQNGESTEWWSAEFFWFLRITTFSGSTIAFSSFIQLACLFAAIREFIYSLPVKFKARKQALILFLASPFFGFFGAGISHDVFLVCGILLIISRENYKIFDAEKSQNKSFGWLYLVGLILTLSMTKIGLFLLTIYSVILLIRRSFKKSIVLPVGTLVFYLVCSVGIAPQTSGYYLWPEIADLKCIAQHPEAEITEEQWLWLTNLAPKSKWTIPISCSSMDQAIEILGLGSGIENRNTFEFLKNYLQISKQNPAIVVMSHINKARVALPPPFFPIPPNQVNLNPNVPIGQGTNVALQSGPEVLHPSIDEPSMQRQHSPLSIFERITQIPTFLINQASWFWGWGGLWLWPIAYFYFKKIQSGSKVLALIANWPTLLLHLFLVLLSPSSLPRYVMSTLICGIILSITLIFEKLDQT